MLYQLLSRSYLEEFEREQYAVQSYLWELWTGPIGAEAEAATLRKKGVLFDRELFDGLRIRMRAEIDRFGPHINTDYYFPDTGQQWKDLATKRDPITGKKLKGAMHPDHRIDVDAGD